MAADNLTLGVFPEQVVIGLTVGVEALVHADRILGFTHKEKLPTYNVFYKARVFSEAFLTWPSGAAKISSSTISEPLRASVHDPTAMQLAPMTVNRLSLHKRRSRAHFRRECRVARIAISSALTPIS